ncbi:MAG: DNA pilot protein [Microviridae sp.]|nr:MAG: DNA pilot protein [Microviridae sp.]
MPITGPQAAAIGQGVGGIAGSIASIINTNKSIKANKELAEYQYSKDLEMWNKGNEYNNPANQMARLKAGGLNPNLVYGSGSAAGNTSAQLPKYNAPTLQYNYQAPDFTSMIGAYQDFQVKQAQIDNLKAQKGAIEEQTSLNNLRGGMILTQQEYMKGSMQDRLGLATNKRLGADYDQALKSQLFNQRNLINPYQLQAMQGTVNQQKQTLEQTIANINKIKADTAGTQARTKLTNAQTTGQYGKNFWIHPTAAQALSNMELIAAKTGAQTEFQKQQNEWYITNMVGQWGRGLMQMIPSLWKRGKK